MKVVVLEPLSETEFTIPDKDISFRPYKDSGAGGQHRNKTESAIMATHLPTGITAKSAEKDQHYNRRVARAVLESKIKRLDDEAQQASLSNKRQQAGCGMRGDKIRTYREKDNRCTCDRTGKKVSLSKVRSGKVDILWT